MSDATVRPGGSAHPTRQQLDDLEALMQRMLALPVNPGEDEPAAELPVLTAEAEPVRREETAWQPVTHTVETVVSEPPPATSPALPQPARETPSAALTASSSSVKPPAVKPPAVLNRVRHFPRWLAPIVWINRAFDNWTMPLGRPGRWLRSRQGRALLGALGFLFMAAAAGWMILSLVGWTW